MRALRLIVGFTLILIGSEWLSAEQVDRIPILLNAPPNLETNSWPVTFGVSFPKGARTKIGDLQVVDHRGNAVPCQIVETSRWGDGSLRWVLVDFQPDLAQQYFLAKALPAAARDAIHIAKHNDGLMVTTGPAQFLFRQGRGSFESIRLDLNRDGRFTDNEELVSKAGGAFYVIDSKGRRGVLQAQKLAVELQGPRHSVVRVEGEYRTENGERNAAGIVYFHFYAGLPNVRISHKLIVTEETLDLWFRDIGIELPVELGGTTAVASFNDAHDKPMSVHTTNLQPGQQAVMVQHTFPHFGHRESRFSIQIDSNGSSSELVAGAACGDWADLSSSRAGLAAQMPAFAEQFPKAFRVSNDKLIIKLWASEAGHDLDFRTEQIIDNYFGRDWIPKDLKNTHLYVGHGDVLAENTARGAAKTHEFWLYPHAGKADEQTFQSFGATRQEIFALADPAWIGGTGVMGLWHPKDTARFPDLEKMIDCYFIEHVFVTQQVFPPNGYLYYGLFPYGAKGFRFNGKYYQWYPNLARLSWSGVEYNFRRGMWILAARSGERKWFDYARRYTRLLGNLTFSNWDSPLKPLGWIVKGDLDSPIIWGAFGETTIRNARRRDSQGRGGAAGETLETSALSGVSQEDVIQFVYDYFLTGDLHSRDMARLYKDAVLKEMKGDVERAAKEFYRADSFLRLLGSVYEIDGDPRIYEYGHKFLDRIITKEPVEMFSLDTHSELSGGKGGDVFAPFYYYYVSTGDDLALQQVRKVAGIYYRLGLLDRAFGRHGSMLLHALATDYWVSKDVRYAEAISSLMRSAKETYPTLESKSIDPDSFDQKSRAAWDWSQMTEQTALSIGLPLAMKVAAAQSGATGSIPKAVKPLPVQRTYLLFKKERADPAEIEVFIHNPGDPEPTAAKLYDLAGKPQPLEVISKLETRNIKPRLTRYYDTLWAAEPDTRIGLRLRVPNSVAPGVYQLDLGSEVDFQVLHSDMDKFMQVAPDGMHTLPSQRYYFTIPEQIQTVDFFARMPIQVFDPSGSEVEVSDTGDSEYRFVTGGKSGIWSFQTKPALRYGYLLNGLPNFVRVRNFPLATAMQEPSRWFEMDTAGFSSSVPEPTREGGPPAPADPFVKGKFDKGIRLSPSQFVQIDLPQQQFPHAQGTVEFWFCPLWSYTDLPARHPNFGDLKEQIFSMSPVKIEHVVTPQSSRLVCSLDKTKGDSIAHSSELYLQAGRWYHIAFTWNIDGKNSDIDAFVNGRKKGTLWLSGDRPWFSKDTQPSVLAPPANTLKIGSAPIDKYSFVPTQIFDEIRVSRTVRYSGDFNPPTVPFTSDKHTYLLLHLDGNLQGELNNAAVSAILQTGLETRTE
ncbi:MAG: hypothetical protein HY360_01315 [Verrucomicrobia bacterium]|nr:hypothetical protein [Verrucomicrobiota bacterium]